MKLFNADVWLRAPLDRDVISRWTVGGVGSSHSLSISPPADNDHFVFLALGDTGDSTASGYHLSPQDAVALEIAQDTALSGCGPASLIVHLGDVVYMSGEKRLYERNFRRPYAPFLTTNSTVGDFTFRVPFMPVPGNHDYYDVGGWARWLARVPLVRTGVDAAVGRLFALNLPHGGSDMGAAYMSAFVDTGADTTAGPMPYAPNEHTRLPNRYYQFTYGCVDFFALDSNTLEAPPPWRDVTEVRADAAYRIEQLEEQEEALAKQLRRAQRALDQRTSAMRQSEAKRQASHGSISDLESQIASTLGYINHLLRTADSLPSACRDAARVTEMAQRRWTEALDDIVAAANSRQQYAAREALDAAVGEAVRALGSLEPSLGELPQSDFKADLQRLHDALEGQIQGWERTNSAAPPEHEAVVHTLTEQIIDVQRELAVERRRLRYLPADHDAEQIAWLDRALAQSIKDRPNNWRVVFQHHPLYTTVTNHCEASDVIGLRTNLLPLLRDRAHLVLAGHAHTFEWLRSSELPNTGLFVSGGGGQRTLKPSLLALGRLGRRRSTYEALRSAGVIECAAAGIGPDASDGENGSIYHYLRIEVSPASLTVHPVGVRKLDHGFRREEPMAAYHAPALPLRRPQLRARQMESVTIYRDMPPHVLWR